MMTFQEWWKKNNRDFSPNAIQGEMKWFAEKAWDAACFEKSSEEFENLCDVCRTEFGMFHNYCQTCGAKTEGE